VSAASERCWYILRPLLHDDSGWPVSRTFAASAHAASHILFVCFRCRVLRLIRGGCHCVDAVCTAPGDRILFSGACMPVYAHCVQEAMRMELKMLSVSRRGGVTPRPTAENAKWEFLGCLHTWSISGSAVRMLSSTLSCVAPLTPCARGSEVCARLDSRPGDRLALCFVAALPVGALALARTILHLAADCW
jgi:hypothetical protein